MRYRHKITGEILWVRNIWLHNGAISWVFISHYEPAFFV